MFAVSIVRSVLSLLHIMKSNLNDFETCVLSNVSMHLTVCLWSSICGLHMAA